MDAFDHAAFCKDVAYRVYNALGVKPLFHTAKYKLCESDKVMCYVHPDDKDKEYVEDFEHYHGEI